MRHESKASCHTAFAVYLTVGFALPDLRGADGSEAGKGEVSEVIDSKCEIDG